MTVPGYENFELTESDTGVREADNAIARAFEIEH